MENLNRRDLFKAFTAAAAFSTLQITAAETGAPLYFTKDEFALLDELTELIIPTDDHSPGARAAGVAAYIDRRTAEAFRPEDKTSWKKGLSSIDELSQAEFKKPFVKASKQQQVKLLTKLSKTEQNPQTDAEKFFLQLKQSTASAYYSSSIGIHQEMDYKGNVLLDKFVGYDAT